MLFGHIVEKLLKRGLEEIELPRLLEIAKGLSKATNTHKGAFGYYEALEKLIRTRIHQGKIEFREVCKVAENMLPANIGSTKFQSELEEFLVNKFSSESL